VEKAKKKQYKYVKRKIFMKSLHKENTSFDPYGQTDWQEA